MMQMKIKEYRKELIEDQLATVRSLNDESFRVKLNYGYVEKYRADNAWNLLNQMMF